MNKTLKYKYALNIFFFAYTRNKYDLVPNF